ncbi:hypothetical protein NIES4075_10450 [Tolypothrix sp. NIES-4075]|nr:hypothetical protein NIES4075_10450 [Tolypothrix sp. NIES-4075]
MLKPQRVSVKHDYLGEYEEVNQSGFFPGLDPNLLLQYIAMPDQYDAVQEFERVIRHIN